MSAETFCGTVLCFFIYSFLGWCCECVYCSIPAGRFINRGFLNGPLCPVYGFGALAVIHCLTPVAFSLPLLFVCGLLVTSALEYFTGWLLETIFHAKWWDYSNMRFNIRGRVCLLNSVLFGLLGVFVMRVLHPFVGRMVGSLSFVMLIWFASALTTLLAVDLFLSVRTALQLSGKLDALRDALEDARARTDVVIMEKKLQLEEQRALPLSDRIDRLLEKGEGLRLHERLNALAGSHNALHRRMLDAFPHMQFPRSPASLDALREGVARMRAEKKERKVAKRDGK
ncbi:hypothetical protein [Anaerotruncus sp. DFI.9.16]|uniref:putative ABC transporter permease n=1 Tax=Anaerotruncus sp. DFI.9.16 TaxID=2965275 RepID=UPI00272F1818|nr:hypothetical protein [Anaerotruncus sp. DFI.9.16]